MFLTSSVALATMGFSNILKEYGYIAKIMAISIMVYSILYGYISANNFKNYINYLENTQELREVYHIQVVEWEKWINLTYLYIIILIVIIGLMIDKLIRMSF